MKLLSAVLGASFLVGALALPPSDDTLEIQNSNAPQYGDIDNLSRFHKSTVKATKLKNSNPKNRIDVFTGLRSCSNNQWFCEGDDRCRYCNGVGKIQTGKDYGVCVDAPRPPSCSKETQDCDSFIQCLKCDGICQKEAGEDIGVCVDKPKKCFDRYTDCKTSEDCGFCGGTCDILEGEKFGLCIDKEEKSEGEAQKSNKIVLLIT